MAEKDLYPAVEKWLRTNLGCFHTEHTIGLKVARVTGTIDVVGLRHVGGDLLGDVEVIGVEVKDDEPYLKSTGQALAYGVMTHRCYLAANEKFNRHQRDIAAYLGVGLISISGKKRFRCEEVHSATPRAPVPLMAAELMERMGYGSCTLCGSPFQISDDRRWRMRSKYVVREGQRGTLQKAFETERGFVYWTDVVKGLRTDARQRSRPKGDSVWDRRYVCPTCVTMWGEEFECD